MSFSRIPHSMINDNRITANDISVYNALCSFTSAKKGMCFPSIQAIADRAKLARSTTCLCLNRLEELGYYSKSVRKDKDGQRSSYYILNFKKLLETLHK